MMNTTRKIIHIDMDCFYASIELRDKPALQNKPVAIGGSVSQRGVLSTCNYPARAFGLHSAMSTAQAFKRCPNLILLPVNMPLYKQVSEQIHQIFQRYTSIIEPLSLDEAYLDVTECERCSGSATWIAQEIRQVIWQELNLTASAGIAPLKFLAKIASDQNKPNGQFLIRPEDVDPFIFQLPLAKIPGVGKVTNEKLLQLGLKTCGDIQQSHSAQLIHHFGKLGQRIWEFSHGIDPRPIQAERERKSVGVEQTLPSDIHELADAHKILDQQFIQLTHRLKQSCPALATDTLSKIGIKLKFDDFTQTTLEKSALQFSQENFHRLLKLIWSRCHGRKVRLIGIHTTLPEAKEQLRQKQMSLW